MLALRCNSARVVFAIGVLASSALAEDAPEPRPVYKQLRYDEDWSRVKKSAGPADWLDSLKYIPLGGGEDFYVTLGGEIRQRFEFFNNGNWGRDPKDENGYLLQRYMLHGDWHLGSRFRFFGQLKSGVETGRVGGPRPADEDRLDVHQAFFDLGLLQSSRRRVDLRVGRQELSFGSSRLVSFREGPNVRQSFDGAKLELKTPRWQVDTFAVKPVETSQGVFDDSPDHTRSFWGVYGVTEVPRLSGGHIDLYYFGLDRKTARFDAGAGREQRHSIGARVWGKTPAWDYNYELVLQWGRFGSGDIRAWTTASDTGYRIDSMKLRPRFGLKADVASGTRHPGAGTLGTFNALFPKGAYFSEADLLGPYNLMDVHPSVELHLSKTVTLTPDADFFWRQSTHDGIYGIPGNLLRVSGATSARYIGWHSSAQVEWRVDRHTSVTGMYLHFFPGPFLKQSPPSMNVNFVAAWISYRF